MDALKGRQQRRVPYHRGRRACNQQDEHRGVLRRGLNGGPVDDGLVEDGEDSRKVIALRVSIPFRSLPSPPPTVRQTSALTS
jgi:hypothetical protein